LKAIIVSLLSFFFLVGCLEQNAAGVSAVKQSDLKVKVDQNGYTSEQRNILGRRNVALDPNQIMWIYCMAQNGQTVFYGPVKGKVTSSTKRLDPNMVIVTGTDNKTSADIGDGSQGESDPYIYWFDPSGKYFQWNGNYFLSTFEIKIQSPVLNTRNVQ
jgi:hypothetical protein